MEDIGHRHRVNLAGLVEQPPFIDRGGMSVVR